MQSSDYERAVVSLEQLPKSSASNTLNPQTNTEEVLCSKIHPTELENQTMETKMTELKNWKKKKWFTESKKTRDNHASQLGGSSVKKLKIEKTSPKQDFVQGVLRRSNTSPQTLHVAQESVFAQSLCQLHQISEKLDQSMLREPFTK